MHRTHLCQVGRGPRLNALLESRLSRWPVGRMYPSEWGLEKIALIPMAREKKTGQDPLWAFLDRCGGCMPWRHRPLCFWPGFSQGASVGRHGSWQRTPDLACWASHSRSVLWGQRDARFGLEVGRETGWSQKAWKEGGFVSS